MVTVLTSVGAISAEIQTHTIHTIASKPLRRWEIVIGKWLGHATMITLYTVILSVGVMLSVYFVSNYSPPKFVGAILVMVLEGLAILSVTLLGSSIFPTLANGVVVFMLYGLAFVGGWVEQIGTIMGSQTATDLGILSSLLIPSEALWRYAAGLMQPTNSLGASVTPFSVTSQPTNAFVIYSAVYTVITLIATILVFRKRDF
jgi:ABC-type transport system involved in multi-copper enzyme maturation permease subunit